MQPLKIDVSAYGTNDEIKNNIHYSLSLGLTELGLSPCKHDGTFVIVGSGPTLKNHIKDIIKEQRAGRPICAINGAADYLTFHNVIPDLFLTTDPRPMPQNFKYRNPKTVYLIASRCHPDTLNSVMAISKGTNVMLWHAWMDKAETDELINQKKIGIGGGTTSGLRAINVAYVMGFRKVHMYGLDSCLDEEGAKRVMDGKMADEVKTIDVIVGGRRFVCNMAMAQQADDFQGVYDIMPDMKITSFGDGLISAIIEQRKAQGMPT